MRRRGFLDLKEKFQFLSQRLGGISLPLLLDNKFPTLAVSLFGGEDPGPSELPT